MTNQDQLRQYNYLNRKSFEYLKKSLNKRKESMFKALFILILSIFSLVTTSQSYSPDFRIIRASVIIARKYTPSPAVSPLATHSNNGIHDCDGQGCLSEENSLLVRALRHSTHRCCDACLCWYVFLSFISCLTPRLGFGGFRYFSSSTSSYAKVIKTLTWNIAAINNNPFGISSRFNLSLVPRLTPRPFRVLDHK
jgi:hypothetical protein